MTNESKQVGTPGVAQHKKPCICGHLRTWHRQSSGGYSNCGVCDCKKFKEDHDA